MPESKPHDSGMEHFGYRQSLDRSIGKFGSFIIAFFNQMQNFGTFCFKFFILQIFLPDFGV